MDRDLEIIIETLKEILDLETEEITSESYIMRDLGAESIDLLELGVSFSDLFKVEIIDDEIFLKSLRIYIEKAEDKGIHPSAMFEKKYPFLTNQRVEEILADLEGGPVLKVKDIASYIRNKTGWWQ